MIMNYLVAVCSKKLRLNFVCAVLVGGDTDLAVTL